MPTFEQGLKHIHNPSDISPLLQTHQDRYNKSILSINHGQVHVEKGVAGGYELAADLWKSAQIDPAHVAAVVDRFSHWIYVRSLDELVDKLNNASKQDFLTYILSIYYDLEVLVQPTLNKTALFPQHGFNGHTWQSHISGLIETLDHLSKDLEMSDQEYKLAILEIIMHDLGNSLGRSAHAPNTLGLLGLIYGPEIFSADELRPALRGILFHDEPIVLPVIEVLNTLVDYQNPGESVETKSKAFLELYSEFSSPTESILRLLDKKDSRRARVLNNKKLGVEALNDDKHFRANIVWDFDFKNSGLKQKGSSQVYEVHYVFNMQPDEMVAPLDSNLVIKPKHLPPELRMPNQIHDRFKASEKQIGYFDLITDEFTNLYDDRIKLVVLDAFRLFPAVDTVEVAFHDPAEFRPKVNRSRERRKNEDIVFTFSKQTLLLSLELYKEWAHRAIPARKIAEALSNLSQGKVYEYDGEEI